MQQGSRYNRADELLRKSLLWREVKDEWEEILRHKWLESEKRGSDVGEDYAIADWVVRHRAKWLAWRRRGMSRTSEGATN